MKTTEPKGKRYDKTKYIFVVQEHHASHLHYDFRLELDGVLKSWAVPKGPSLDPKIKRLAVEVEDHPVDYATFKGNIPRGEYGAGRVNIWDSGVWKPLGNPREQLKKGRLEFELYGSKLKGRWVLVRTNQNRYKFNWLLIKRNDDFSSTQKNSVPIFFPQLATLVTKAPTDASWLHEIKLDGYRTIAVIQQRKANLYTRRGLDWTQKYIEIARELEKIQLSSVILDGEIVVLNKEGISDFDQLQKSIKKHNSTAIKYIVFDILFLEGNDLRKLPLFLRKEFLSETLKRLNSKMVIENPFFLQPGDRVWKEACRKRLEGIISKNLFSEYESLRTTTWLKVKCKNLQEFVVGGFTYQKENHSALGALLVGAYNSQEKFQYLGRVGTGFTHKNSQELIKKFKPYINKSSPFSVNSPSNKSVIWLKPELVINVEFGRWTAGSILRHAAFKGLREDKLAHQVTIEKPKSPPISKSKIGISNPNKILFSKSKETKKDLLDYYTAVEPLILPHIMQRPLSILRCPNGESKTCFFQKHIENSLNNIFAQEVLSIHKKEKDSFNYVENLEGLVDLVQLGVLEIHTRGCHIDTIDYSDQLVFDLDPDPGVAWDLVKEAALELKDLLSQLQLVSFLKVSGGKGLHIHVPIKAKYNWQLIKNFTRTVCEKLVETNPQKYTLNLLKKKRKGRIFLDYLRNGYGATAIAPYSTRAKPNASIAFPISWKDLSNLEGPNIFTMAEIIKYLKKRKKDPWQDYFTMEQEIFMLDRFKNY